MTITQELERLAERLEALSLRPDMPTDAMHSLVADTREVRALAEKYRGCVAVKAAVHQGVGAWWAWIESSFGNTGDTYDGALTNLQQRLDEQRG